MEQEIKKKNPDPFLTQIVYECFGSWTIILRGKKYTLF